MVYVDEVRVFLGPILLSLSFAALGQEPCHPTFSGKPTFDIGHNFGVNAVADFNDAGHLDLTVGARFFLGDGTGAFPEVVVVSAEVPPFDVVTGDFDLDGHLDAATVFYGTDDVAIYWGKEPTANGRNFFESPISVPVDAFSENVWHLAKGHFNEDDLLDFVCVSIRDPIVLLLSKEEKRSYEVTAIETVDSPPHSMLTAADFDGDGSADLATGGDSDVSLYFGNGDGTFGSGLTSVLRKDLNAVEGHRFRSADIDGDGRSELLASAGLWVIVYDSREIDPIEGLPAQASVALPIQGGVRLLEIVDMNDDGLLDVVELAETASQSVFRLCLFETTRSVSRSHQRSSTTRLCQDAIPCLRSGTSMQTAPKMST